MYGLGRKRSAFGRFCERHKITQTQIVEVSGLNRETVSRAFVEDNPVFRSITKQALVMAASKLSNKPIYEDDFW